MNSRDIKIEKDTELLAFLQALFPQKSKSKIKSILTHGMVIADGKPRTAYNYKLKKGQTVTLLLKPAPMEIKDFPHIIFESDDLLVINKPAGLLSMASDNEKVDTAYRKVRDYVHSKNPENRIFIVHRLDKDTSGVLMFAKNEVLKRKFQNNWNELIISRGYTAVVEGILDPPSGTVRSRLLETETHLVYSTESKKGDLAITRYSTLKAQGNYSLLDLRIDTGRKNQIRVHMKDLGAPVAGDKKYGAKTNPIKRLALHAHLLELRDPVTSELLRFKAPCPKSFYRISD